jgi:hypothetical protein
MENELVTKSVRPSRSLGRVGMMAALVAIACFAVAAVPRLARSVAPGDQPPVLSLWAVGLVLSLCGSGLLLLALRGSVRPGVVVACYGVVYNVLIVVATFSLGPEALYQADAAHPIDQTTAGLIPLSVFGILLAYLAVFLVLAAFARSRLRLEPSPTGRPSAMGRALTLGSVALVAGALFASGGLPVVGVTVGVLFAYPVLVLAAPMGGAVAAALFGALVFASAAFARAADRARLVRDASVLSVVLWSGALLVLLYNVLWYVYVLLLISLWPLKTVTSK